MVYCLLLHGVMLVLLGAPWGWQDTARDSVVRIPADKEKGFHSPYFLAVPQNLRQGGKDRPATILVIPNNTGTVNDDPAK